MSGEGWPEWAEKDPSIVRRYYLESSENFQAALEVLARHAPERLTYEEVERELGWPRGRWGRVIGGFKGSRGENSTRPYHICPPEKSSTDQWEAWMDEAQANAIRDQRPRR